MKSVQKILGRARSETSWSVEATRVGPYRLCLELASGGMATVYLAHAGGAGATSRFAAVKVIHPHLTGDDQFAEMFIDEAEIASRIRHPNVCDVYEFEVGGEGDVSYIAMEYLLGASMAELQRKLTRARRTRDVARDARFVCRALADACEGLHAAHELTDGDGEPLEVVHRDVSPGNIMVSFDGVTKVVDFGVAAAARKRHRTETGMLKGKFAYIAPECLRGQKADRRSDVWGIGVLAWELVTKQRLFRRGSDVDTLRAVMDEPVRPPSEVRSGIPEELDTIIMLALQRDPEDRYATARDLGRDLARFANREDLITSADLAEWLEELFPGARERRVHELELAAQLATGRRERGSVSVVQPVGSALVPIDRDIDPTRVYERTHTQGDPSPFEPAAGTREPTLRIPRWRPAGWMIGAALVAGLSIGGLAVHLSADGRGVAEAQPPARDALADDERRPPLDVAASSPTSAGGALDDALAIPTALAPALRLQPGAGLARGPYVLELVESGPDELVLRIRLDLDEERAHDGATREATEEPRAGAPTRAVPRRAAADSPSRPHARFVRESPY